MTDKQINKWLRRRFSQIGWVLLFYYLGLLPFISIPEKFLICFLPTIINRYLLGPHLSSKSSPRLLAPET